MVDKMVVPSANETDDEMVVEWVVRLVVWLAEQLAATKGTV